MSAITFAQPYFLWLLIPWAILPVWYILRRHRMQPSLQVPSLQGFSGARSLRPVLQHALFVLRVLVLALLIILLSRPQSSNQWTEQTTEGIDIVLALDISGSMLAMDFQPDRLEAAKDVAISFISGRPNDRIGLVVFSGESFTQCPLTTDHAVLMNLFRNIRSGMIEDGTAIGLGLANAVSRIKDSPSQSKVIILLTDGVNNMGSVAPLTAAEIAKSFGIRVYTVGIGSMGMASYPVQTPYGVQLQTMETEIDEEVLQGIASLTGGKYFRATDNEKLQSIYAEIDQMERSLIRVEEFKKKKEEYLPFALAALGLLLAELVLRYTYLRSLPS
jgi:Ca-activated chloride channel family protein